MKRNLHITILLLLIACSRPEVEKFGVFEQSFTNKKEYDNSYFDVDLEVKFYSPNGTEIRHFGFYDGNQIWKFRFMPAIPGKWKYTATFSDGSNAGSGSFICTKSNNKGPLTKLNDNPIWFATQNGKFFLMRSFHVGDRFFASNWNDSEKTKIHPRTRFLNWVEKNNYNTLSIASFFTNRQTEGRGKGWETPQLWPLDYREFQKAEIILNELAKRQIYVFPFAGFFGRDGIWPTDHAEQEKYVKYIISRWGAFYNLIFNVAGPEPLLEDNPSHKAGYKNQMEITDINRIANLIKKYDVFHHLITVHNQTKASVDGDPFVHFEWYGFSTIQGPKTKNLKLHEKTVTEIRNPQKPYFAQETLWGGNKYHPDYGEEYIRKIGIVLTMNAAMINFADNDGDSSSGFSGSLNPDDCTQNLQNVLKNVWDFFETIPLCEMKPDTTVVPSKFVLAGEKQILIYTDKPDSFQVNLPDGRKFEAQWINAQNLNEIINVEHLNPGELIKTPGKGDDWFLQVFAREKMLD